VNRVDIWDETGDSIVKHVAGVDDFEVAEATYRAAVARWPAARITLRLSDLQKRCPGRGGVSGAFQLDIPVGRFSSF
jgi:hypothetical protein